MEGRALFVGTYSALKSLGTSPNFLITCGHR
jgi:hypothetical protein